MTTKSNWMKVGEAYAAWLFTGGLTGVVPGATLALTNVRLAKRVDIPAAWKGAKSLHIVPQNETQESPSGNSEDVIGYGFGTVLVWPGNSDFVGDLDDWLNWREVVRNKVLPTTEQIFTLTDPLIESIRWEPGVIYDPSNLDKQHDAQGFTLRVIVYEQRHARSL